MRKFSFHIARVYTFSVFFILYLSLNSFSVMLGRVSVGLSGTKQRIKCLAQRHNAAPLVKLETATP